MSKPFHVYLDLDVRNDDILAGVPPALSFEETRTQPFLEGDASDYFCAIARFTLQPSNSLPVLIPVIDTNQGVPSPSVNQTVYKISFYEQADPNNPSATRQLITQNIVFVPENRTIATPKPPSGVQDTSSEYYHLHSYKSFINMINTTLRSLYSLLPLVIGHYNPPYIEWDNASCTATLYADTYFFDLNGNMNAFTGTSGRDRKFEIYFNSRLYQLFSTLPSTYTNATGDLNYRLDIFGDASNTTKLPVNDTNGGSMYNVALSQEISTVAVWSPIESIVFTSTSLPIHPSLSSIPRVITSGNTSVMGSGQPNILNILTDFQVAVSGTNQYRPEISYVPQGEYRLVDMFSNSNLSRIDLQVYWRDKTGELHRILLYPGCSASVKLLFRHKGFYLGAD